MEKETMSKNVLNKKLFDDDYLDEILAQFDLCNSQGGIEVELSPDLDKDLLSGRDIIDLDGEWEDDYFCVDSHLTAQMISFCV